MCSQCSGSLVCIVNVSIIWAHNCIIQAGVYRCFGINVMYLCEMHNVKIGAWNIHGLGKKLKDEEVISFVHNLDFVAFTETWTTVRSSTNFSGYGSLHQIRKKKKKRGRPHGGILFLYKAQYNKYMQKLSSGHEDVLIVKVGKEAIGHSRDIIMIVAYVKPTVGEADSHSVFEVIEANVAKYADMGDTVILGDFNARTGTRPDVDTMGQVADTLSLPDDIVNQRINVPERNNCDNIVNERGKQLLDLCITTNHCILNGRFLGDSLGYFTFLNDNGCSTVDYTLANHNLIDNVVYHKVLPFSHLSDHSAMETSLAFCNQPTWRQAPTIPLKPLFDRVIYDADRRDQYVLSLLTEQSQESMVTFLTEKYTGDTSGVGRAAKDFNNIVSAAAQGNFKVIKRKKNKGQDKQRQVMHRWYDRECRSLRNSMRKLRGKLRLNPFSVQDRNLYLGKCREYKGLLKYKERKFKAELVERLGKLAEEDPKAFWSTLKSMQGKDDDMSENIPPSEWQSHFEKLGTPTFEESAESQTVIDELKLLEDQKDEAGQRALDYPVTIKEIKEVLRHLKPNKAHADDLITNEMLKHGASVLLPAMAKLFNLVLESSVFPAQWNMSYQVPLYKKGDVLDCGNYRGISITSCVGKVFNSILSKRINQFLEENSKLSRSQAAFRKSHSTLDHVYTLKTIVNKYVLKHKSKLYCCFVDFKKAYDSVWREGMLVKLRKLGIGGKYYSLVKNMYSSTQSCVKLPQGITPPFQTSVGIKQGDNLSPTLFNIFIDDVCSYINNRSQVLLNGECVNSLLYADDLLIIAKSPKQLQQSLDKLDEYCKIWKLQVNTQKTKIVVFRNRKATGEHKFTLSNQPVEVVDSFTYLGVTFVYNGNFKQAINDMHVKARKALFKISTSLKSKDVLNHDLYTKLFDCMVKPILLYGSQVWSQQLIGYFTKEDFGNFDRLVFEQLNNKMCKYALHVGRYTSNMAARAELGRMPLLISIATLTIRYWASVIKNPSKLTFHAYQEEKTLDTAGQKNWVTVARTILEQSNLATVWTAQRVDNPNKLITHVKRSLEEKFERTFSQQLNSASGKDGKSGNKLRTYKLVKSGYATEKYLQIGLPVHNVRAITKIRISAHDLEIERGRRAKPTRTPADRRFCKHCGDKVEDEVHFITECTLYKQIRAEFLRACPEVEQLGQSGKELFVKILSSPDENVLRNLGIFVCRAQNKRKCLLY